MNLVKEGKISNSEVVLTFKNVSGIIVHLLVSKGIDFEEKKDFLKEKTFYVPEFRDVDNNVHSDVEFLTGEYIKHVDSLYNKYSSFIEGGLDPQTAAYALPMAMKKDVVIKCTKEKLIDLMYVSRYGNWSDILEVKEFGRYLESYIKFDLGEKTSLKRVEESIINEDELDEAYSKIYYKKDRKRLDDVQFFTDFFGIPTLLRDFDIIVNYLMKRYNLSYEIARENTQELLHNKPEFRKKIIDIIIKSGDNVLDQVNYRFEFPSSLLGLSELSKTGLKGINVPFWSSWEPSEYYVSEGINNDVYKEAFIKNEDMIKYLVDKGVKREDLIYLYLNGNTVNAFANINAREMIDISNQGMCELATGEVKYLVGQMVKKVSHYNKLIANAYGAQCETKGKCEKKNNCGRVLK